MSDNDKGAQMEPQSKAAETKIRPATALRLQGVFGAVRNVVPVIAGDVVVGEMHVHRRSGWRGGPTYYFYPDAEGKARGLKMDKRPIYARPPPLARRIRMTPAEQAHDLGDFFRNEIAPMHRAIGALRVAGELTKRGMLEAAAVAEQVATEQMAGDEEATRALAKAEGVA